MWVSSVGRVGGVLGGGVFSDGEAGHAMRWGTWCITSSLWTTSRPPPIIRQCSFQRYPDFLSYYSSSFFQAGWVLGFFLGGGVCWSQGDDRVVDEAPMQQEIEDEHDLTRFL